MLLVFFFFFKQKTAYEIHERLVGSEMCIRDRPLPDGAEEELWRRILEDQPTRQTAPVALLVESVRLDAVPNGPHAPDDQRRHARRPLVLAAAALVVVAVLVVALLTWPTAAPVVPVIEPIQGDLPTESPTSAPTVAPGLPERTLVTNFAVPFSLELGELGRRLNLRSSTPPQELLYVFGADAYLSITHEAAPSDLDDWAAMFADVEGAEVSAPFPTTVGGVAGTAIDVTTPEEVPLYITAQANGMASDVTTRGTGPNARTEGSDALRIHRVVVDLHVITVLIISEDTDFPSWLTHAGEVLDSIRWNDTGAAATDAAASPGPYRPTAGAFDAPFSLDLGPGESLVDTNPPTGVHIADKRDGDLLFVTNGPASIEAWAARAAGVNGATVSEPFSTRIGGVPATAIDMRSTEHVPLYDSAKQGGIWMLVGLAPPAQGDDCACDGAPWEAVRIHVLEVGGETVSILALAPADEFDAWALRTDEILAGVRWGVTP